ncbi:SEC-C metal-binding domain-containing protein [Archangium primigenium]|uniref:SEC-C metal-binding domain-containing protein n=1 Tax=[Archangium] primigenium TaxID=2792470 RepID=UPI001955F647|nr:SEC-C metal-binding domain-containing protein [Archangium primigenium]MBM7115703.1 SEC-C domain-containing protein [Archangium primigenium]
MGQKKLSRNAKCPCGSGSKYKACCYNKGFHYLVDDDGTVVRSTPLHPEAASALKDLEARFTAKHGRPPGPNDLVFDPEDMPDEATLSAQISGAMERTGIPPALIYAFKKTGLLLTDDNRHLMPTSHVEEFEAAVDEYYALHPEEDEGLDS